MSPRLPAGVVAFSSCSTSPFVAVPVKRAFCKYQANQAIDVVYHCATSCCIWLYIFITNAPS